MPRPVVQATPRARKRAATQKGRLRTSGREREWSETGNERREPALQARSRASAITPIRRAPESPCERRSFVARRAPARLRGRRPPRRLCRAGPRPAHDAPAEPRRSSQHRAATRGAATVMAASGGPRRLYTAALRAPCEAPRAAARQPPRLRPLSERRYRMPDPQPASRRAVRSRGRESAGNGGGYLAQRGLGSPGARPALGGGVAQLEGPPEPQTA